MRELFNRCQKGALSAREVVRRSAIAQGHQRGNCEDGPPHSGGGETDANRHAFGDADFSGAHEQDEIEGEQDAPANVSVGVAFRRNGVAIGGRGDFGEQGVVNDFRRAEGDVGDEEQQAAEEVIRSSQEKHRHGGERAEIGGSAEKFLLATTVIRDGADHGKEKDLEDYRDADGVTPETARVNGNSKRMHVAAGIGGAGGEGREIRAEEQCNDGGIKRRVREIVHAPADLFPLAVFRHFAATSFFVSSAAMVCSFT